MQVSRTVRCLQGNQALRTLQLLRSFEDVPRSAAQRCYFQQHHQLQQVAPVMNYFKSQYSTEQGNEKQTLQTAASSVDDEDNLAEILELVKTQAKDQSPWIHTALTSCYNKLNANKSITTINEADSIWNNRIKPKISTVVEWSLADSATPDMRKKCLAVLLHYDATCPFVSRILERTLKEAQYLTIKDIADVVHLLSVSGQQMDICKDARKDLVLTTIHNRWFEIGPQSILLFLYQLDELFDMKQICFKSRQLSDQSINSSTTVVESNSINMEKRLICLVEELKPKDLARVVTLMGKWRNRKQILLHALAYRLSLASMSDFSLFHLCNLLFACSTLSIYNAPLLDKLSKELSSRELSLSVSSSVLSSLSHLRWHDPDLVFKCLSCLSASVSKNNDHCESNENRKLSARESQHTLRSLANLYTLPTSDDEVEMIKSLALVSLTDAKSSPLQKVDAAWCLAILRQLDGATAGKVLDPGFVQELNGNATEGFQSKMALQKLRGVNLAAKFELEGYEGPYMDEQLLNADPRQEHPAAKALTDSLLNALSKFADMQTYVKGSQSLPGGLHADAVMCSDAKGSPKPLSSLDNSNNEIHRVAIQVVPFFDVVISDGQQTMPSGAYQMASRHLRHLGYIPVQIPHSDLRKSQSVLEHINSIQSRLRKAVCDDNNNDNTTSISSTSTSPLSSSLPTDV